ncbi:serine hydrolase domain-containing protein [Kineosporia succinea]|uniref:Beta-lactamase n=1 Tax=Kineosporia succinea TaxID=84632 RepID=A0ABT9PAE9_9ACTN|nr:serine hydrolase domain-containing protein [Kineosporia succinea]MDP9829170.1 CubicO group peptidase (beta-lactamase class C family) [Kineosporia succinea]
MNDHWGDEPLATRARRLLGRRHPVAAVATVTRSGVVTAGWGAEPESDFEIGSISKGVTGLLYRDAVERGVVRGDTTLGELLPLTGGCAGITLSAISQHRSGLPGVPASPGRSLRLRLRGENPCGGTVDELIEQASGVEPGPPRPRSSTFAFELLGHALARASRMTYPELVHERIASRLGLKSWYLPADPSQLRPGALTGCSRRGRARPPWTGEALGPAGGIRSTVSDLGDLARALLDGRAPGMSALDPVARLSGSAVMIGAAWITLEHRGRAVTGHHGGTGGFRSWIGLDRESGTGAVVLSATARPVDGAGFCLLP